MRFTVPQFIEREAKIVGPLTFKQFIFIGTAGAICFILYFTLGKTNFSLFLLLAIIILGTAAALAFVQVGGRNLPTVLLNALKFFIMPRIYFWQREEKPMIVFKKEIKKEVKKEEEKFPLKISGNGQLKKIRTQIEIQTK